MQHHFYLWAAASHWELLSCWAVEKVPIQFNLLKWGEKKCIKNFLIVKTSEWYSLSTTTFDCHKNRITYKAAKRWNSEKERAKSTATSEKILNGLINMEHVELQKCKSFVVMHKIIEKNTILINVLRCIHINPFELIFGSFFSFFSWTNSYFYMYK